MAGRQARYGRRGHPGRNAGTRAGPERAGRGPAPERDSRGSLRVLRLVRHLDGGRRYRERAARRGSGLRRIAQHPARNRRSPGLGQAAGSGGRLRPARPGPAGARPVRAGRFRTRPDGAGACPSAVTDLNTSRLNTPCARTDLPRGQPGVRPRGRPLARPLGQGRRRRPVQPVPPGLAACAGGPVRSRDTGRPGAAGQRGRPLSGGAGRLGERHGPLRGFSGRGRRAVPHPRVDPYAVLL